MVFLAAGGQDLLDYTSGRECILRIMRQNKIEYYSACPNNRRGIVELSGAGNPKKINHIYRGRKVVHFSEEQKKCFFEAGVIGW